MTALQQDGAGVGWNVHTGRMGQCAALEFKISNVDKKVFFKKKFKSGWMDGQFLEQLYTTPSGTLSNLGSWKVSLSFAGGWTRWTLNVPSNPNHSLIL